MSLRRIIDFSDEFSFPLVERIRKSEKLKEDTSRRSRKSKGKRSKKSTFVSRICYLTESRRDEFD